MATFRRVGDKWRAEVCVNGVRKSKRFKAISAKSKTAPLEAIEWAAQAEREISSNPDVLHGVTFGESMERYALEVSPLKKGAKWEVVRLSKFQRNKLSDITMSELTGDDLVDWRDRSLEKIKPGSVSREMTLIKSVARKSVEWKYLAAYPFDDVKPPPKAAHRTRRPTQQEIEKLCLSAGMAYERLRADTSIQRSIVMFLIAIESGMRLGEICSLSWSDVDLSRQVAHLDITKNGDSRDVPLSKRAVELFQLAPSQTDSVFDITSGTASTLFRRIRDASGIKDLTFHDSRHEACTRIAKKEGIDVLDLAKIIGHRDINNLLIYFNPTPEELAQRLG